MYSYIYSLRAIAAVLRSNCVGCTVPSRHARSQRTHQTHHTHDTTPSPVLLRIAYIHYNMVMMVLCVWSKVAPSRAWKLFSISFATRLRPSRFFAPLPAFPLPPEFIRWSRLRARKTIAAHAHSRAHSVRWILARYSSIPSRTHLRREHTHTHIGV